MVRVHYGSFGLGENIALRTQKKVKNRKIQLIIETLTSDTEITTKVFVDTAVKIDFIAIVLTL